MKYQWQLLLGKTPKRKLAEHKARFDVVVLKRNADGMAARIKFQLYARGDNDIFLVSGLSDWACQEEFRLQQTSEHHYELELDLKKTAFAHKSSYGFWFADKVLPDPASSYLDAQGRSVFWDYEDPSCFRLSERQILQPGESVRILQTTLPGLIYHYREKNDKYGHEYLESELYRKIAKSGVVKTIKALGFNAIQFLPLSQSLEGDKWSLRYLSPYPFALDNRWGDPDDFARMIAAFQAEGIALIHDFVVSHVPYTDFQLLGQTENETGLHHWRQGGDYTYLKSKTSWGTMRYDYADESVREFLSEAALHWLRYYQVDGFRIDNVDGILRHGENGDGREREGGRATLRHLHKTIYEYSPHALIHLEAHYFYGDNAKMLVAPMTTNSRALGAAAYNSSRLTYFFHHDYMLKSADEISPWQVRDIIAEKEWGMSASEVADFHNHDAAAGLMPARATGSYAYDAMTLGRKNLHQHAVGKIKTMEAIISLGMEGRTLDLLQSHLLQTGTFEHDNAIHWQLADKSPGREVLAFKQAVNHLLENDAFWPLFADRRRYTSVDDTAKTLVIVRQGSHDTYLVLVNMSAFAQTNYLLPVPVSGSYQLVLDSDLPAFAGTGNTLNPQTIASEPTTMFEFFPHAISAAIAPYHVLVWKKS